MTGAPITYVALLRGINVGGRNPVSMADLRRLVADAGHEDVRTYVQSGNVIFRSSDPDAAAVATDLQERLASAHGVSATVLLRTVDRLGEIVAANPFAVEADADPTRVHVAFLSGTPEDPDAFAIDVDADAPDRLVEGPDVLYLHLPNGLGRSKLAARVSRSRAGVEVTVRNWRTVTRLLELAQATAT